MWITQFLQRFISLIKLKFEIIELFSVAYTPIENLNNFKCTLKIRQLPPKNQASWNDKR